MTSNRLQFKVTALHKQINQRWHDRIKAAEAERAAVKPYDVALAEWRAGEIKRIRSLASRFTRGTVTDHELAHFSTEYLPRDNAEQRADQRLEEEVRKAYDQRDQALARLDAIRAYTPEGEADAVIELTPSMARDWFGI